MNTEPHTQPSAESLDAEHPGSGGPSAGAPSPKKGLTSKRALRLGLGALLVLASIFVVPTELFSPEWAWSAPNASYSLAAAGAIFAVLAYSIGVLLRFLDLPSGGHGALFGVGAYASAIGIDRLGLGFETALLLAIVATVAVGIAMGALSLRTTGMAFLIITIALGELVVLVLLNWDGLTNGPLGMFLTSGQSIFGMEIDSPQKRYYVALGFLFITVVVVWFLSVSRFGRRLIAIRDNEPLAKSLGLRAYRYKVLAFVVSAALAGVAGHLYFMNLRGITPELFHALAVISVFLMVVMGGFKSLAGPAVGAWIVVFLPVWFEPLGLEDPTRQELAFGVLLIAFMLLAPMGIMGAVSALLDRALGQGSRLGLKLPTRRRGAAPSSSTGSSPPAAGTRPKPKLGEELLTLDGVTKAFRGVRAVDDVSFAVRRGEVVGIIGPNGSGKTTLVNVVTGFLTATAGKVAYRGSDISTAKPDARARRGLVRTFQQSMSFAEYSPRQHCELVFDEHRAGHHIDGIDTVHDVLTHFGLQEVADTPAADLPYGHVSNTGLAAALASRLPELLILDEPAAGLSTTESQQLQQRLLDLRTRGLTILIIDHDMSFLMPMCDRVVVLDAGRQIAEGPPAAIQQDPSVIAAYLGERYAEKAAAANATKSTP